ncbi:hypothetical protein MTR67_019125 [Solanum verrucosum]|uniref:Uncharacterized protein n=1 Tax=Solanum verrucosum TaxID=315347 RepID=A0AAF0QR75_SOLVR|nr:hypothetical protein MTR67_019125 [Solanum verrucosum]
MSEDLTLENPQPPLKKSFSIGAGKNSVIPDPLILLSLHGSDLCNFGFSRYPQLSLYPPIAPLGEILPLLSVSPVMHEPATSLSLYVSNINNLGLSRLPQLSHYPPSAPIGEIFTLSSVAPGIPDPSTYLSLSLPRFRSTKDLNPVNRIEQIGQLAPISVSKPTPSNFMPQISITHSGNVGHKYKERVVEPKIFGSLQDMIRKEVKNYMSELETRSASMNTEAIRDAIVNKIAVSKD